MNEMEKIGKNEKKNLLEVCSAVERLWREKRPPMIGKFEYLTWTRRVDLSTMSASINGKTIKVDLNQYEWWNEEDRKKIRSGEPFECMVLPGETFLHGTAVPYKVENMIPAQLIEKLINCTVPPEVIAEVSLSTEKNKMPKEPHLYHSKVTAWPLPVDQGSFDGWVIFGDEKNWEVCKAFKSEGYTTSSSDGYGTRIEGSGWQKVVYDAPKPPPEIILKAEEEVDKWKENANKINIENEKNKEEYEKELSLFYNACNEHPIWKWFDGLADSEKQKILTLTGRPNGFPYAKNKGQWTYWFLQSLLDY